LCIKGVSAQELGGVWGPFCWGVEDFRGLRWGGAFSTIGGGLVIAELIWTLRCYYRVPKEEVIEKVSIIISTPNLHVVDRTIIADALVLYSQKNIDFIDACIE
jgi:hypothetical protein